MKAPRRSALRTVARKVPGLPAAYGRAARAAAYLRFLRDYRAFRRMSRGSRERFRLAWSDRYPCLADRTAETGFDRHYVFHPAWAARILAGTRPAYHVDVSSTLYFCALVSSFLPVKLLEYRPAALSLGGLAQGVADLRALPLRDGSVRSLSCMHVVEHVGLGRYGDPLDPDGDLKAMAELVRVLAPGGSLLFVVPVGRPRILFNAHRVYSYGQVLEAFAALSLREFALVPDDPASGGLVRDAPKAMADAQAYGCGCFWFRREGP